LKAAVLAGECQEIFTATILTFHTSEAVVQITAVRAPVNDLLKIGTVEPVLTFKLLVIDPDKVSK